jgi:hypothetical protein
MERDAKTVASELMELVARCLNNPDHCKNLLAVRLEVIYDYAYALGYTTGKRLAKDLAYDIGFSDGFAKATQKLEGLRPEPKSLGTGEPKAAETTSAEPKPAPRKKTRELYHLPCEICGSLYTEDECPVCKARAVAN